MKIERTSTPDNDDVLKKSNGSELLAREDNCKSWLESRKIQNTSS